MFVCSARCSSTLVQKYEFLLPPVGCARVGCHAGMNERMIHQNTHSSHVTKSSPTTPGVLMEEATFVMATWEILLTSHQFI